MLDVRKLNYFYYSQNSLNTFKKCPLKFKMKYIDNISWKNDSEEDIEYYEGIKVGLDFHLICERYFSKITIGNENCNKELIGWTNSLLHMMPIDEENVYLPEYEIKIVKNHMKLQAKYDLIIIKPDESIEIWDWKTENRKLLHKEMEKRFQTIVYMYVLKEGLSIVSGRKIDTNRIKMNYWQPQYEDHIITIDYSEDKHKENEVIISETIQNINKYDFSKDFNKSLYIKQCKFCEFNYFCNNEKIDSNVI
ncbi:PD-(D/E)XK nuclease family protein [Clostridium sp. PL3]|uniref:PD-(D/E)XK nuclease family protein n=1 Tax=Clostridium thailandense TaxID=2794346 RepID=A0A949WXY7_9CLOT|nr:PD-(D/E)XK nuclease family protein [Clostridium thailandense]MBV7276502.1 PD-(D/E)XK nuclease family protein [Clostridium thailandense]